MPVDALLLERPHEALGDAVALRFPDIRRRDRAPEPLHLVDPRIGNGLRAPVTSNRQAAGDLFSELAEGVTHALANRLERRPPTAQLRRVPAHHFAPAVIARAGPP